MARRLEPMERREIVIRLRKNESIRAIHRDTGFSRQVIRDVKVVAEEKAANIQQQRRSIRKLGKTKLKKMILQIFGDIICDDYRDSEIAKDFGLTKATFSRFAGSRWNQTGFSIPDLWRNTAQVLIYHPIFRQVVKDTGFWDVVAAKVKKSPFYNNKARSHD